MALIHVPNVTLNRGSLANASRIIKANMTYQSFDQALIDSIPVLVPYQKSIVNFFGALDAAWFVHKSSWAGWISHGSPQFYRDDINAALKKANFNFWYEEGAPLPDSPPILITEIADMSGETYEEFTDPNADITGNWIGTPTSYVSTLVPSGMSFIDGVYGGIPKNTGSHNPLITATNEFGSTQSNIFNMSIIDGDE